MRAGVNTLAFFIRMLTGYYLYCRFVSGFLPKAYVTIWVRISFLSFFPAYVCGYTKGAVVILLRRNPKEYVIETA